MTAPQVTVAMVSLDAEATIRRALRSIVRQSFSNWELLVVDGGSKDNTRAIVEAMAVEDKRIRLVVRPGLSIPRARNLALAEAQGQYMAVLDADDWSAPSRFKAQVDFLDGNPGLDCCGTWVQVHDGRGRRLATWRHPTDSDVAAWTVLFQPPVAHSSALFRVAAARACGGYPENPALAEDYALWVRMAGQGRKISNLGDILTHYQAAANGVSQRRKPALRKAAAEISRSLLESSGMATANAVQAANLMSGLARMPTAEAQHAVTAVLALAESFAERASTPRARVAIRRQARVACAVAVLRSCRPSPRAGWLAARTALPAAGKASARIGQEFARRAWYFLRTGQRWPL